MQIFDRDFFSCGYSLETKHALRTHMSRQHNARKTSKAATNRVQNSVHSIPNTFSGSRKRSYVDRMTDGVINSPLETIQKQKSE